MRCASCATGTSASGPLPGLSRDDLSVRVLTVTVYIVTARDATRLYRGGDETVRRRAVSDALDQLLKESVVPYIFTCANFM